MAYTYVESEMALYRTTSGPPPHRGPWEVLTRKGWGKSTGPGFDAGVVDQEMAERMALAHAGDAKFVRPPLD